MDPAGDPEDATDPQTVHGPTDDQKTSDAAERRRCSGQGTCDSRV